MNGLRPSQKREILGWMFRIVIPICGMCLVIFSASCARRSGSYSPEDEQLNIPELRAIQKIGNATCAIGLGSYTAGNSSYQPVGSGVIIGKNLMLTCRHNYQLVNFKPQGKAFTYGHLLGRRPFIGVVKKVIYDSSEYDFMLLEFEVKQRGDSTPDHRTPILQNVELQPGTGLSTWGFPNGGGLSQSLNSQIVFPYEIYYSNERMRNIKVQNLAIDMAHNLLSGEGWDHFSKLASSGETKTDILEFLNESYTKDDDRRDRLLFRPNLSRRHKPPEFFPVMACNPDTKPGDSGGPVLSLSHQSLVGILRGSRQDLGAGTLEHGATTSYYEVVIPISVIVKELDGGVPGWRRKFGVKFVNK